MYSLTSTLLPLLWPGRMALWIKVVLGYVAGFRAIENSQLLTALTWAYALFRWQAHGQRAALAACLLCFPRFRLGFGGRSDADKIPLFEHLFRLVAFRRVDLKLPPSPPLHKFMASSAKYGPWQRQQTELEMSKLVDGRATKMFVPLQRFDWTKPSTMVTFVSDAADVEHVLSDRASFPGRGKDGFHELNGEGLIGLESGAKHTIHRSLVICFLTDNHLREYSKEIVQQIKVLMAKWKGEGPRRVNAHYDLSMLTLDIIMLAAFGAGEEHLSQHIPEHENESAHTLDMVLKNILMRSFMIGYQYLPTPHRIRVDDGIQRLKVMQDKLVADCVAKLERDPNAPRTMLSEMLRGRREGEAETGIALSDKEIADELFTIRGAGHETTSNTLCWVMLLLARNPDKLAVLQREVDFVVKGDVCTFDESKQLKYAVQVVYETMRLFPTVPQFPRECQKDVKLKGTGYDVPAGSIVLVSQCTMNRNAAVWGKDADEFVPERFSGVGELKMGVPVGVPGGGPKYGFAPFGAAGRGCVGQRLALMEAIQILATMVKHFEWTLAFPEKEVTALVDITMGPKEGLFLDIKPRRKTEE